METIVVSVRLDERLVRALDAEGERSDVIRQALEEWVRRKKVTEMLREHEAKYRAKPVEPGEVDWLLDAAVWPDEKGTKTTPVVSRRARPKPKRKKRDG